MPRTSQFSKDDIAAKAIDLIREKGADALSARTLCAALGCSVSPIFTMFQNMDEVIDYTRAKTDKLFSNYVADVTDFDPAFKEFGLRLVRFARHERNLFEFLFLNKGNKDQGIPPKALECLSGICRTYDITREQSQMLFRQMWALTCGLSVLITQETDNYPEETVSEMLSIQFMSMLMLIKSGRQITSITPKRKDNCNKDMKHEIIDLQNVQVIGFAKEIAFKDSQKECPKAWADFIENIIKPVVFEKKQPDELQQAAFENGVGEFGLCTCSIPNHDCSKCALQNFGTCNDRTFTYVVGGMYKGGKVPEGMRLFDIPSGKWVRIHFEGGMAAFQEQFQKFNSEWLPAHPEFGWARNTVSMEWYKGTDIQSPDYQCGIMFPLEK